MHDVKHLVTGTRSQMTQIVKRLKQICDRLKIIKW